MFEATRWSPGVDVELRQVPRADGSDRPLSRSHRLTGPARGRELRTSAPRLCEQHAALREARPPRHGGRAAAFTRARVRGVGRRTPGADPPRDAGPPGFRHFCHGAGRPDAATLNPFLTRSLTVFNSGSEQIYVELGSSRGDVAHALALSTSVGGLSILRSRYLAPGVRARLMGWLTSGVIRGLFIWLPPSASATDTAAFTAITCLLKEARRCVTPAIVAGNPDSAWWSAAPEWLADRQCRHAVVDECAAGGGGHLSIRLAGAFCGPLGKATARCDHFRAQPGPSCAWNPPPPG